jgi:hypothetical protein
MYGECVTKPVPDIKLVRLAARALHCIESGKGLQVTAVSGTVWITQANDARDVVIACGDSLVLDRKGRTVVSAFMDAVIAIGPPPSAAASLPRSAATTFLRHFSKRKRA